MNTEYGVVIPENSSGFKLVYRNNQVELIFIPDEEVYFCQAPKTFKNLYSLPEIDESQLDNVSPWLDMLDDTNADSTYYFTVLEIITALASNNLLPKVGTRSPATLLSEFLKHLDVFGYLRPPLTLNNSFDDTNYREELSRSEDNSLLEYQKTYDNQK